MLQPTATAAPRAAMVGQVTYLVAPVSVGAVPHLDFERSLFSEGFHLVGAVDEVGRGSAFGPSG